MSYFRAFAIALALALTSFLQFSLAFDGEAPQIQAWHEYELAFETAVNIANPYTEVEASVVFEHDSGRTVVRQMFWDGGKVFKVRFTPSTDAGTWRWQSICEDRRLGLDGKSGSVESIPSKESENPFHKHGFWSIPKGGRNLIHADGTSRVLCADTPWALPWRATEEQAETYAEDRQAKGFNASLLMTVQPDRKAVGPRDRTQPEGFDVGFEDLPDGELKQLVPGYF